MNIKPQSIVSKACECELEKSAPDRISFEPNAKYSHMCRICSGGITAEQNDKINQYYGYSGYDEEHHETDTTSAE